ncbi:MAG: histidine phosphatase family protein [Candidatus Aenigmatarchaeota archaeon]
MKLYFITHPAVNIDPDIPVNKWSISKEGWKQVRNLSDEPFWKEVDVIFASTEQKANKTAEYWSKKFNIPLTIVNGIEEIDRSSTGFIAENEFWKTADDFYATPDKKVRGWESANECLDRMVKAMEKIVAENGGKNIAVVSHGAVGNLYACRIKGTRPSHLTGQTKIGSWFVLDLNTRKIISDWREY